MNHDAYWMNEALACARQGIGMTRPNPPVGAVLVRDGQCVGKGFHRRAGGPHAEKNALRQAGARAAGATLYVTLEPCSTHGRTSPCTDAIIRRGIARVVMAVQDPNPRHAGRAVALLRKAGIRVTQGVGRAPAAELLEPFAHWITNRTPWVTLKLALSADGKLADHRGVSKWITSPPARHRVQAMRREADAIMVGAHTVLRDDPCLLPRPAYGRTPWRVVVDALAETPPRAAVLNDAHARRTLVAVSGQAPAARVRALRRRGADLLHIDDLNDLFTQLGQKGIMHVLCEGGGCLAGHLLAGGHVHRLAWFYAPCIIGGTRAVGATGETGWPMEERLRFAWERIEHVGADVLMTARLAGKRARNNERKEDHV